MYEQRANQARSEVRISWRAACQAGAKPPSKPMIIAKITAAIATPQVRCRLKTVSLKVRELPIPVLMPLNGNIKTIPTIAPSNESSNASITNEVRMLGRENPMIRRVAISFERYATAAYIVFMAAKLEPIAMMIATNVPINLIAPPELVCFS